MILYLWTRYAILIHRYWQLSWQFYVLGQVMSFLHSFPMIFWLEQDAQFSWGGYFAFSGYPMKKRIVPINAAHFPWPETTKIKKFAKNWLTQKFCDGDDLWLNLCVQAVESKAASTSRILHFISCEKLCSLGSKSKCYSQNKIFLNTQVLWRCVKGWQI